mgnify:FL=1
MNTFEKAANATYLTVLSQGQLYGIPLKHVVHIIPVQKIREAPELPSYVKGKIKHEGTSIPVIDLRLRLGLKETAWDEETCIVVMYVPSGTVGLLVDAAGEIKELADVDCRMETEEENPFVLKRCIKNKQEIKILDLMKTVEM